MKLQYIEYLSNESLPESVRQAIPDNHTQELFRAALNSHLRDGKNEPNAYMKAYRFLQDAGYQRTDGKWVAKDPGIGDVHVDSPLGGGSGKKPTELPYGDIDAEIEKAGRGVMVAFWPDIDVANRLAVPDGEKPEEMHITLAYLGKNVPQDKIQAVHDAVKAFAAAHGPLSGTIGKTARFEATEHSDGKDVAYAQFDSPDIQAFRADLVDVIEKEGVEVSTNFDGYTPHITLEYIEPSDALPQRDETPIPVTFGAITVSAGSARSDYPLEAAVEKRTTVELVGSINKLDSERRMAFGFVSIIDIDGRYVIDSQEDGIKSSTLETAIYNFVLNSRAGGVMHSRDADNQPIVRGQLVESIVFTVEKQQAIQQTLIDQGIDAVCDLGCVGAWCGFLFDEPTWERIRSGELKEWSISGSAKRAPLDA